MVATSNADFKLPITCYHKSAMMFSPQPKLLLLPVMFVSKCQRAAVISTEIKHRNLLCDPVPVVPYWYRILVPIPVHHLRWPLVAANPHSLPGKCDSKGVNVVIIWWENRKWVQIGNVRPGGGKNNTGGGGKEEGVNRRKNNKG